MSKMIWISTSFFILEVMSRILLKSKCTLFNRTQSLTNDDITVSKSLILSKNSFSVALFIRGMRRVSTHWPYKRGHTQMPRSENKCPGRHGRKEAGDKKIFTKTEKSIVINSNITYFSRLPTVNLQCWMIPGKTLAPKSQQKVVLQINWWPWQDQGTRNPCGCQFS